jgi:16S rRNA G1207 methylase RsmC
VNTLTLGYLALFIGSAALILHRVLKAEDHTTAHLDRQTHHLERFITMTSQDAVDAVTAQLSKAKEEILAEVAALEAQVAAGQPVDLTGLKAAAQGLDDLTPDPVVEPVPEPPAPVE